MTRATAKKPTAVERTVPLPFTVAAVCEKPLRRYRVKPSRILWRKVQFDWIAEFDKKSGERPIRICALKPDGFAIGDERFDTLSAAIAWVERRVSTP